MFRRWRIRHLALDAIMLCIDAVKDDLIGYKGYEHYAEYTEAIRNLSEAFRNIDRRRP